MDVPDVEADWDGAILMLPAAQPRLVKVLQEWFKQQDELKELKELLDVLTAFQPLLEVKARYVMVKLLEVSSRDCQEWDVVSAAKNVEDIGLEARNTEAPWQGRVLRASGYVQEDAELICNHIWADANRTETFFDLNGDDVVFELRRQFYKLPWPM